MEADKRSADEVFFANLSVGVRALVVSKDTSEAREDFAAYLSRCRAHKKAVFAVDVPGDTRPLISTAEWARNCSVALANWGTELTTWKYTLNGQISASDFVVDHMGHLRGTYSLSLKLNRVTDVGRNFDMTSISSIVEHQVYNVTSRHMLPRDVCHFLGLLDNFSPKYSRLVNMHICHASEPEKSAFFLRYVDSLATLRKHDSTMYRLVLGHVVVGPNWLRSSMQNSHLHYMMRFNHTKPVTLIEKLCAFLTSRVGYSSTVHSCLDCRRNGEAHLFSDYSIDSGMGLDVAIKAALAAMISQNPILATAFGVTPQRQLWSVQRRPRSGTAINLTDAAFNDTNVAAVIADAIAMALQVPYVTYGVAEAAAATTMAGHVNPLSRSAGVAAARAASAAQMTAMQGVPQPHQKAISFAKVGSRRMFTKPHVGQMFAVSTPDMLHTLQFGMFEHGQLDDGTWDQRCRHIRLLDPHLLD